VAFGFRLCVEGVITLLGRSAVGLASLAHLLDGAVEALRVDPRRGSAKVCADCRNPFARSVYFSNSMTETPVFGSPRRGLYRLDIGSLLANASRGEMFALIGAATRPMIMSHSALLLRATSPP
jgi:hypothetical protein